MPKLTNRYPKKCRDRNQAFSWYNGKRIYHGTWGSPEAEKSYKRFIAALLENPSLPLQMGEDGRVLVSELAAGFLQHIESRNMDSTDVGHFKRAIGYLVEVYGELSVNEFSPKKLKVVRNQMVKTGTLSRPVINLYVRKIRSVFSWGTEEEVVNSAVVHAIREVKALRKGEQGTSEPPPRKNVPDDVVRRTLPFLPPTVAAMVQVQRMLGARPSEVFNMRVGDIERTRGNGLWYYVSKVVSVSKPSKSDFETDESTRYKGNDQPSGKKKPQPTSGNPSQNDSGVALPTLTARGKGYKAHGRLTGEGNCFVVLAGSTINQTAVNSTPDFAKAKRKELQSPKCGVIKNFVFEQDHVFRSASAAAAVVGGRSVSAQKFWKS